MMADDETSGDKPPAIVLDEHDVAAVAALLIRTVRLDDDLKRDKQLVADVSARIATNAVARNKTVIAFGVFGFDTGDGLWDRVRQSLGGEAYSRAITIGHGHEVPKLLERMGDDTENSSSSESSIAHAARNDSETSHHAPRVKDAILGYLQDVGDAGATARSVRQHLADVHNLTVHEKTPGMTLYRLLKGGLVRREGRTWHANIAVENNENEASNREPEDASETAHTAQ